MNMALFFTLRGRGVDEGVERKWSRMEKGWEWVTLMDEDEKWKYSGGTIVSLFVCLFCLFYVFRNGKERGALFYLYVGQPGPRRARISGGYESGFLIHAAPRNGHQLNKVCHVRSKGSKTVMRYYCLVSCQQREIIISWQEAVPFSWLPREAEWWRYHVDCMCIWMNIYLVIERW